MAEAPMPPSLPTVPLISEESPKSAGKKPLIIVAVILLLLVAGGVAAYYFAQQLTPAATIETVSPTPEVVGTLDIPVLSNAGTTDTAQPEDVRLMSAVKDPATFADLNNSMSAEALYTTLQTRLGLKTEDTDNDGLGDLSELLIYGTNPFYHDSDLDGVTDNAEVSAATFDAVAVANRKNYWKTDFALSAERQQQAGRDLDRISQAGKITLLLSIYYEKQGKYPVATTWQAAWTELVNAQVAQMFTGTTATGFNDPLNQTPYVFEYSSIGTNYTFAYTLEGAKKKVSQTGTAGKAGVVTETLLTPENSVQKTSWMPSVKGIMQKITSVAQAITYGSGVATTTDGYRVKVFGDLGWVNISNSLSFEELKAGFLIAASHGGGYCTSDACYCSNGTTLAFGKNDSICGPVSAPAQVTVGQAFPVSITMQNAGVFWSEGYTMGFWKQSPGGTDDVTFGVGRVNLPKVPVQSGESAKLDFTATAPTIPGRYYLAGRMVEEGVEWFGAICPATSDGFIDVVAATPVPSVSATGTPAPSSIPVPTSTSATTSQPTVTPTALPNTGPSGISTPTPTPAPTPTFNPGGFRESD